MDAIALLVTFYTIVCFICVCLASRVKYDGCDQAFDGTVSSCGRQIPGARIFFLFVNAIENSLFFFLGAVISTFSQRISMQIRMLRIQMFFHVLIDVHIFLENKIQLMFR